MGKLKVADIIEAVHETHGLMAPAARRLGVSRSTLYRYLDNHESIRDARDEARESVLDLAESKLFEKVEAGDLTAIMFLLKTVGKTRGYVERSQAEQSGKLTVEVVRKHAGD